MRFLGVDPGGKRMGLAVGDDVTGVVSPLEVVPYDGAAKAALLIAATARKIMAEWIVIGLPALADGSIGSAARRSQNLAGELQSLGFQVALQSEYLSTNEARRRARSAGRRSDRPVDDIAAQVVLEEYLETRRNARDER